MGTMDPGKRPLTSIEYSIQLSRPVLCRWEDVGLGLICLVLKLVNQTTAKN